MPLDPFFSRYDGNRRPLAGRQAKDVGTDLPPSRLAGRRPAAQAHRAPEPPPAVESPLTSEKPPSDDGRGQIRLPQRLAALAPFLVHLATVVESPAAADPAPFAIDAEALRVLDQIAALDPEALAGVAVAKGVTITNGGRFVHAHRQALSSSSPAQRRTAAANIYGAAAAIWSRCATG